MAAESSSCDLCGLPVLGRPIRDREHDFCCEGCRRVYVTAEDAGISDLLAGPEARRARSSGAAGRKAAAAMAAGARRETLRVDGMWCSSCGLVLEDALMALPGVLDAEASYAASLARVTWDPEQTRLDAITERIALLGYSRRPRARGLAGRRPTPTSCSCGSSSPAVIGMWVMWPTFFVLWPAFAVGRLRERADRTSCSPARSRRVVLLYGGWPFLVGAWRAARVRRATMDTLVVLGTWTAWFYSAWATADQQRADLLRVGRDDHDDRAARPLARGARARGTRALRSPRSPRAARRTSGWCAGKRRRAERSRRGLAGVADAEQVPLSDMSVGDTVAVRAGRARPGRRRRARRRERDRPLAADRRAASGSRLGTATRSGPAPSTSRAC